MRVITCSRVLTQHQAGNIICISHSSSFNVPILLINSLLLFHSNYCVFQILSIKMNQKSVVTDPHILRILIVSKYLYLMMTTSIRSIMLSAKTL